MATTWVVIEKQRCSNYLELPKIQTKGTQNFTEF